MMVLVMARIGRRMMSAMMLSDSTLVVLPGCLYPRHPTLVQTCPEKPSSQGLPSELGRGQMLTLMDRSVPSGCVLGMVAASALKELMEVFPGEAVLSCSIDGRVGIG